MSKAAPRTPEKRLGPMRRSFETWIRRGWHNSWAALLDRNEHGTYIQFDVQQAWFAFQAGWRRARK